MSFRDQLSESAEVKKKGKGDMVWESKVKVLMEMLSWQTERFVPL